MRQKFSHRSMIRLVLIAGSALVAPAAAFAQGAPASAQAPDAEPPSNDIVVTGFRQSLEKALNVKRESVSAVDAIVAEDIAKFPDQNLAELLQRVPGVSIQRDGGEGRAIIVRGLGPQFTRVRVNGMETVATSADGASADRERGFDFNVFASELFNSIQVHKTPEAQLDEGSLGAVVDLNTGNPLGGKRGVTVVGSVQGSYNTLSKNVGPRIAGLLSYKSEDGTFGAAISAAYSKSDTLELGNNTTRWEQAAYNSVNGVNCFTTPTSTVYVPSTGCDAVTKAFSPRIPRYGQVEHDRERLGITGSIQWQPSDRTTVSIDALYSRYKERREEQWGEILIRSNERSINVNNYNIDANNTLVSGTLNNAYFRTEHYLRQQDTKFYQISANWKQEFTDSFRIDLLAGLSKSDANIPVETTIMLDNKAANGYAFDYTNSRSPTLVLPAGALTASSFQLSEIRDRPSETINKFRTVSLKAEWDVANGIQIQAGGAYRKFDFNLISGTRDTLVCPAAAGGLDAVLGTINCSASTVPFATAIYGFPVTTDLTQTFNLGNAGQPSGATASWLVANLPAATAFTKLYSRTILPSPTDTRSVAEQDKAAFLQLNAKGNVLGMRYAFNAGMRFVRTEQASTGLNNGTVVTINRTYDDWLPAFNLALFPADKLIIRAAVSKVMTRPNLSSLSPGGSVDGFNYKVTFGNPNLDPYRATAYDLAVEYYFAPESIFSVAYFKKNISSLPISNSIQGTYASTGLPLALIPSGSPASSAPEGKVWTIATTTNGTGGKLDGFEFAVSGPFHFLPGVLRHFGGIANLTVISSSYIYGINGPSTTISAAGKVTLVPATVTNQLPGLAKTAYNFTLWYEDAKFSARASYSYRSGFIDSTSPTSGTGNVFEGYNAIRSVDASLRYKITPQIEVSLEGTNLTDAYRDRYTDEAANRVYENNHFGRTILFGARMKI